MPAFYEWIAFLFAIITVPFYCFLIFVLHMQMRAEAKRNNAFYVICCIVGYVDIASLLNTALIYYPPRFDWQTNFYLETGAPLLRTCFFISWASAMAQLQSTMLITLNRFTSLVYAAKHDMIWRNRVLPIMAIILVPAVLLGTATFLSPVEYIFDSDGVLIQKLTTKELTKVLYGVSGLCLLFYTVAIFIIYGIVFKKLREHQKKQIGNPSTITSTFISRAAIHKRREMKLLFMSIVVCLIQVIITCYIVLKFSIGSNFDSKLDIYNVLVIAYSGINPYLLIGFSEVLRHRALRYLFCFVNRPITPTKVGQVVMTYPRQQTTTTNSRGC
ncbi:CBR-SRV-11 protein [Aphelenchoides bicaudatus]|nr:CBR-SRV-11 protein [Aphelenchoides bicaudatus]